MISIYVPKSKKHKKSHYYNTQVVDFEDNQDLESVHTAQTTEAPVEGLPLMIVLYGHVSGVLLEDECLSQGASVGPRRTGG